MAGDADEPGDFESDGFGSEWEAAAEWGLASLVVGAVALLAGLLCLLLVAVAAVFADRLWNGMARIAVAAVGYGGWVGLVALGVAGVRFGRRSASAARRLGQPPARGQAGVLLGSLGLFAAAGAGLAWTLLWIDQLR